MDAMQVLQITLGLQVMQLMAWLYIVYLLRGKQPKRKEFPQIVKKYTDLGGMVAPIPEVDRELEQRMKSYYTNGGEMKFTEKFIMDTFKATQVQAQTVKAKWMRDGILKVKNETAKNSPHVLASYGKMRKL